jgi:hypothetical protein
LDLIDNSTFWMFISGSDENSHVDDIIFGLSCLIEKRGVSIDSIAVFIDKSINWNLIDQSRFPNEITIHPTHDIENVLNSRKVEKLVVIVTGHGSEKGMQVLSSSGENSEIKPYQLLNLIKNINDLQFGLIILGQCYAGTFNFLDLSNPYTGQSTPKISIIGATDLQVSISATFSPADLDANSQLLNNSSPWIANVFLTCFMHYVANPVDIDGDGLITVLDIYKAALIKSNKILIKAKSDAFLDMQKSFAFSNATLDVQRYSAVHHEPTYDSDENKSTTEKILDKAEMDYNENSALLLSTQNSWILNVDLAKRLKF